jgi:L-amino acid N-acyltransferase YncA
MTMAGTSSYVMMKMDSDVMESETRTLSAGDEALTLAYLRRRPLDNVALLGLIGDYGLEHPLCRGRFYGHFRADGLAGVALVGHHVLLSGGPRAVASFAQVARRRPSDVHMVLGAESVAASFARQFVAADVGTQPRYRVEEQLFLVLHAVAREAPAADALRPAQLADVDEVAEIHAHAYAEQTGIDPRALDAQGFRARVQRRIALGRIWVASDARGICFKTDVAGQTEGITYLEGVVTRADVRGRGVGTAHLAGLCRRLLAHNEHVCLFVNAADRKTAALYRRLGFRFHRRYRVIRFQTRPAASTSNHAGNISMHAGNTGVRPMLPA